MSAFVGCRGCKSRLFKGNKSYQIFTPKGVETQSHFINIFASPILFCFSQKSFPRIKLPQKSIFGNMGNHEMPGSGSASDAQEVKWVVDVVDVFPNCANLIILHRPLYVYIYIIQISLKLRRIPWILYHFLVGHFMICESTPWVRQRP